jgi:UbiD family decarboxylase
MYDLQAISEELDRRRLQPILLFQNVRDSAIPIISNVMASRRVFAYALGVDEADFHDTYARRLKEYITPVTIEDPVWHHSVFTGDDVDLGILPIPTYFPGDAGPYLTASMTVAKDPDTGVETQGYHRYQIKERNKMGLSLHSRRRMFEYQRRAEKDGRNLQAAICLGLHPVFGLGALSYPPPHISKYEVIGGLFEEPMEKARCRTIDLEVPAWADIVIEGEILANVRESEGPFGEFTGYFSTRSTEHVFQVRAICLRENAWFQSISSGRVPDHILDLGLLREVEIRNTLGRVIPNVVDVSVPTSGCSSFSAFVSIKQTRPGEAKHAITTVLSVDHYIKLVVVVDDDIDVTNESEVLWALATRFQADRDLLVIPGSLGAMLDPSASEEGLTAKMGIDATRPYGEPFAEKLSLLPESRMLALKLVDGLEQS